MAAARNARPLPALARAQGLHPPPDADALLAQGYSVPAAPRELPARRKVGGEGEDEGEAAAAATAVGGAAGGSGRAGAAARRRGSVGGGGETAPAPSSRPQAPRGGGRASSRRRGAAPASGNKLADEGEGDEMSE